MVGKAILWVIWSVSDPQAETDAGRNWIVDASMCEELRPVAEAWVTGRGRKVIESRCSPIKPFSGQ